MEDILSILPNYQNTIPVIKSEKIDDERWDLGVTDPCLSESANEAIHEQDTHNIKSYRKEENAPLNGPEENEIDIKEIYIKQEIVVNTQSNPSLLLFVTPKATSRMEKESKGRKTKKRNHGPNVNIVCRRKKTAENVKTEFHCDSCEKVFSKNTYLITHSLKHKNLKKLECSNCGKFFKHKAGLSIHMKIHLNENFNCIKCKMKFNSRNELIKHSSAHKSTKRLTCDLCLREFPSKVTFRAHFSNHIGDKPFKCIICPKSFLYKHSLNNHILNHNKANVLLKKKKFKCVQCNKSYLYESELKRHAIHHTNNRPWLCSVCGKGYALKATLNTHLRTHDDQKGYSCNQCSLSFIKKTSLEVHVMKQHENGMPSYMCDKCPKFFYSRECLKQHIIRHLKDKSFMCSLCKMEFSSKQRFKVHVKLH